MMYTQKEFEILTNKYGKYASWAIWDYYKARNKEKSVEPIYNNLKILNSRYVLVGLNISSPVEIWTNFRGGKHDRKLKYAFNDSILKGSYMTDLFKTDINVNSFNYYESIKENHKLIERNVSLFVNEMADLKISSDTTFIIFGTEKSLITKLYKTYFQKHFTNIKVIYHRHYSSRGFDKDWVESIWNELNIQANFKEIKEKYK